MEIVSRARGWLWSAVVAIPLVAIVACGSGGGDDGDVALTTSTSSSSSSSTGDTTSDTTAGATTEDATTGVCEPGIDLDLLRRHLADLTAIAAAISGEASALQPVGFLTAPGYESASVTTIDAPLADPCAEASFLDPVCEAGVCRQLACTGVGAGWSLTHWIDPAPAVVDGRTFNDLSVVVDWGDGAASIAWVLAASVSDGPALWSVQGSGSFDGAGVTITEYLGGLADGPAAVLMVTGATGSLGGTLEIGGVVIAEVLADGSLMATGACP